MNKIKIFFIALLTIIIGGFILYGVRMEVKKEIVEQKNEQVTSTSTTYFSTDGETADVTYYSDNTATLTLSNSEYQNVRFVIAMSASGARYENIEKGLVLWEKAPELTIYKDDKAIFIGSLYDWTSKEFLLKELTSHSWVWSQTRIGSDFKNPDSVISPDDPNKFTITFSSDGKISGTTDCNNFSGTYSVDGETIEFGSLMSTLMYCENSKEQVFLKMLSDGKLSLARGDEGEGRSYYYSLYLTNDNEKQSILFEKK